MNIIIIGHGGHSKVITDIIQASKGYQIIGYLDHKYKKIQEINDVIYGPILAASKLMDDYCDVQLVIAIGDNKVRKAIVELLDLPANQYATLVHPLSFISPSAKISHGTVVMPQTVINADVVIGNHCIINSGSVVEHDCQIEDFVHLCPNSTIAGAVKMSEGSCLGSGATIIPNKVVGKWTMIGAGATVTNHITENCLAVGVPAREKLNNRVIAG